MMRVQGIVRVVIVVVVVVVVVLLLLLLLMIMLLLGDQHIGITTVRVCKLWREKKYFTSVRTTRGQGIVRVVIVVVVVVVEIFSFFWEEF